MVALNKQTGSLLPALAAAVCYVTGSSSRLVFKELTVRVFPMRLSPPAPTPQVSRRAPPLQAGSRGHQRRLGRVRAEDEDRPSVPISDWREFRAHLVKQDGAAAGEDSGSAWPAMLAEENQRLLRVQDKRLSQEAVWAHATSSLEPGGVLLATPQGPELLRLPVYWQLVILLLEHGANGSSGIILNRPCQACVGDLNFPSKAGQQGDLDGARLVRSVFSDSNLYLGGVFAPNRVVRQVLTMLHGFRDLPGCREVVPGIYRGGERGAAEAVLGGQLARTHFRFFAGLMHWRPGALAQEVESGAWFTAACSRSLVLKQCLGLPVPLWRELLALMGGEHGQLAQAQPPGNRRQL